MFFVIASTVAKDSDVDTRPICLRVKGGCLRAM